MADVEIAIDDLTGTDIIGLLRSHLAEMRRVTPQEKSVHALDVEALRGPGLTIWSLREDGRLAGCGALKRLDPTHAEIKSMRTAAEFQRRGVAARLLAHIESEARSMGVTRLSLETGAEEFFEPARRLYLRSGFAYCDPFGDYLPDPLSLFMTKKIA